MRTARSPLKHYFLHPLFQLKYYEFYLLLLVTWPLFRQWKYAIECSKFPSLCWYLCFFSRFDWCGEKMESLWNRPYATSLKLILYTVLYCWKNGGQVKKFMRDVTSVLWHKFLVVWPSWNVSEYLQKCELQMMIAEFFLNYCNFINKYWF